MRFLSGLGFRCPARRQIGSDGVPKPTCRLLIALANEARGRGVIKNCTCKDTRKRGSAAVTLPERDDGSDDWRRSDPDFKAQSLKEQAWETRAARKTKKRTNNSR